VPLCSNINAKQGHGELYLDMSNVDITHRQMPVRDKWAGLSTAKHLITSSRILVSSIVTDMAGLSHQFDPQQSCKDVDIAKDL
jgi:hypothetical protein